MTLPGDQSLKESLECPVCKDLFSEPKQLECGHTYCLDCVNGLDKVPNVVHRIVGEDFFGVGPVSTLVQSVQNNVQCPQCRKMCLIPDGGLNTNYAIKDMVEKFHQTVQLEDDEYFDGITNAVAREAGTQTKKDEQQQQLMMCHSCAKRVPGSELFMCKDCNGPMTKNQIICALCVVHSHKLHTVVPLVNLASAGDRELAVLRIEEILYQAQRVGDETRNLQTDVTRQFEAVQEKLLAKLDCFRVFQSECRDSEQSALKEDVEAKVCEAIHQCEQLNEHFLRLNELKMEFERQLQRWQDDLGTDAGPPPVPSSAPPLPPPPQQPSLYYLRQYGSIFGPDQQPTATSSTASSGARPMHHFVFSSGGGTGDNDDGTINPVGSSNSSSRPRTKKAPPILVAQRRRSRLRGNLGAGAGGGGAGGASGSAACSSNNNNSDNNCPPGSARMLAASLEQSLRQRQRDDFKRFDENYGLF